MSFRGSEDRLFRLSIGLFFIGGFLTAIVSLLVPRLKLLFALDYRQAMLVQLTFHSSYLLFAFPAAALIVRLGYMRSIAFGVSVMAGACIVFLHAEWRASYAMVLGSLLLLSAGISVLQIAGNTVVTVIGPPVRAASRLTLLQGFNSFGTVAGPLFCAQFMLGDEARSGSEEAARLAMPILLSIAVLVGLAIAYFSNRDMLPRPAAAVRPRACDYLRLARSPRVMGGVVAIFVYVGAEVTIGSLLVLFLMLPAVIGAPAVGAGRMVGLYWGGAMIGRVGGAFLLRRLRAQALLALAAFGAAVLVMLAVLGTGWASAVALILVGLCNSIMYPTIFALALPDEEWLATPAATLLCVAVVGGAIVPVLTGMIADALDLKTALILPALCYVAIIGYALACRRDREEAA